MTDPAKKAQLAEWYMQPWSATYEQATSAAEAMTADSGDAKATKAVMTWRRQRTSLPVIRRSRSPPS